MRFAQGMVKSEEGVRLQKFLADQGVGSRRAIEAMIEEGRITVDGAPAVIGQKVQPESHVVEVDGRTIRPRATRSVVIALNKPKGVLCSHSDPHHTGKTVFDLVPSVMRGERLFFVGRLDKDSEGLVLLTSDGAFAQKVAHPSKGVVKRYRVELDKNFDTADIPKMLAGVNWEGERLQADKVIPNPHRVVNSQRQIEVHLTHGRKREIRRLLYAFGYEVKRLERFQIGRLTLRGLPKGRCKILNPGEIERLFG
jgi:23S rRNA pseudouridine2605 synthase